MSGDRRCGRRGKISGGLGRYGEIDRGGYIDLDW
jgi:hypothetical protein